MPLPPYDAPLHRKFTSSETGLFSGYAATFGTIDATGDLILPGAFAKSLRERGSTGVCMLWQHGRHSLDPIGEWTDLHEDSHGLFASGRLFMDLARANERLTLLRKGAVSGLSVRFSIPPGGAEWDPKAGVRKLKEVDLWEISPVTWPADPRAKIRLVECYAPLDFSGVKAAIREAVAMVRALRC